MKIEPQPAKKKLLVVIQNIMPKSSLWLGDMCLVFWTVLSVFKGSQNRPHSLPQDCASELGNAKEGLGLEQSADSRAVLGQQQD